MASLQNKRNKQKKKMPGDVVFLYAEDEKVLAFLFSFPAALAGLFGTGCCHRHGLQPADPGLVHRRVSGCS